jgi:hypothetical protein
MRRIEKSKVIYLDLDLSCAFLDDTLDERLEQ